MNYIKDNHYTKLDQDISQAPSHHHHHHDDAISQHLNECYNSGNEDNLPSSMPALKIKRSHQQSDIVGAYRNNNDFITNSSASILIDDFPATTQIVNGGGGGNGGIGGGISGNGSGGSSGALSPRGNNITSSGIYDPPSDYKRGSNTINPNHVNNISPSSGPSTSRFHLPSYPLLSSLFHNILTILSKPHVLKFIFSFLYLFTVMFFLALILVGVHLRLPDRNLYPRPLPDIVLDFLPRQSWGLTAAEASISSLSALTFLLAIFHKHTFVVLRRLFCVIGTIFFYRAFCVISTQLAQSNSDLYNICPPMNYTNIGDYLSRAIKIMVGMGMRINGGQTCGDYVYSGHTVSLTVFNLFIVYYTPMTKAFLPIKILTSLINILGMACILLAHEHYTVDVVLALIITLLVFTDYHNVANNPQLRLLERQRIILFSPVAYFMERDGENRIKNRLRIPFWKTWREYRRSRRGRGDIDQVLP